MGSDTTLPVLSKLPRSIFDYFTELFAQVTNPPLDAIREELVTSTRVVIGGEENLLSEGEEHCHQIVLPSPVLSVTELMKIRYVDERPGVVGFRTAAFDGLFPVEGVEPVGERLARALDELADDVVGAVRDGVNVVILSDRGTSAGRAAIPSLLLVSAVHHRLVTERLRTSAALDASRPATSARSTTWRCCSASGPRRYARTSPTSPSTRWSPAASSTI